MSAGIAEVLGANRNYFLFDSFEGLPAGTRRSGRCLRRCVATRHQIAGLLQQLHRCGRGSCGGNEAFRRDLVLARQGMVQRNDPQFVPPCEIAVLRLDGDWYDSTRVCLENLYPYVAPGGIVIVDDYYIWDGSRARSMNSYQVLRRRIRSRG